MVQIKEADRDVLRFLWIDETDNTNRNIAVKRFNQVLLFAHQATKYEVNDPQHLSSTKKQDQE